MEKKTWHIAIDYNNGFIDGSLGSPQAQALVPRIAKYLRNFDGYVIATQDTHGEDYLQTLEGKKLDKIHCVKGTWDWEINPVILKAMQDKGDYFMGIVEKPTFGSYNLIQVLRNHEDEIADIEISGLCTGICVLANAVLIRAAFPNMIIRVRKDLTECLNDATKQAALTVLGLQQIDVIE